MDRALGYNFHCTDVRRCGGKLERNQMVSTLIPDKHETAFISLILDTTRYVGAKVRGKIDFCIEKSDKQPEDLVSSFSCELNCVIHRHANQNLHFTVLMPTININKV